MCLREAYVCSLTVHKFYVLYADMYNNVAKDHVITLQTQSQSLLQRAAFLTSRQNIKAL